MSRALVREDKVCPGKLGTGFETAATCLQVDGFDVGHHLESRALLIAPARRQDQVPSRSGVAGAWLSPPVVFKDGRHAPASQLAWKKLNVSDRT